MRNIRFVSLLTVVVLLLAGYGNLPIRAQVDMKSGASGGHDTVVGQDFEAMLAKIDSAQQEFHNGRPASVKAFWSHADDVTLAGGAGGPIEKGWEHVGDRLNWASTHYSNGVQTNERIISTVSGGFAYVVQVEHIRFHVPGQAQESKRDYRVTMVFRHEPEGWRIVHRQADTQMTPQAPR